jgi:hypothetical protein
MAFRAGSYSRDPENRSSLPMQNPFSTMVHQHVKYRRFLAVAFINKNIHN